MRYKLYKDVNKDYSIIQQILYNRGIAVEEQLRWIEANILDIYEPELFGNSIYDAAKTVYNICVNETSSIGILVDCDCDGFSSAAIAINFIYHYWPRVKINYYLHSGKQHGLGDMDLDKIGNENDLLICPDSSTNDVGQCEYLKEKYNLPIVIADHHEQEIDNPYCILVNNQCCDYPNKNLSGAGVMWQICRMIEKLYLHSDYIADEDYSLGYTRDLLDLCAFGALSDMMDFRDREIRSIVINGLSNIKNPFLYQMSKDNEFTLNKYGGLGYKAVAFAITPFVNATIRSGTEEEKESVFRGMCLPWCFEEVPNTKRGHKGEKWPLYQQAAYITAAAKRRQTKLENEAMVLLDKKIQDENLLKNAIILCLLEPGEVEPEIRGLAANKLASKYQRPCAVLTKSKTKDDNEYFYRGSMRNYGLSEIDDLKSLLEATGKIEYCVGHSNAAGLSLSENNIIPFLNKFNSFFTVVSSDAEGQQSSSGPIYWIDYAWSQTEAEPDKLLEIAEMAPYWGQDVPASQICIEDINLSQCQLRLCGQKNDVLRMVLPNGLVLVKFQMEEEDFDKMCQDNMIMTCIVSPQKNEWQGKISGEGIIEDFELNQKWVF